MLCWFLPYNNANEPQLYMYHLPLEPSPPSPHPSPLGHHVSAGLGSLSDTATSHQLYERFVGVSVVIWLIFSIDHAFKSALSAYLSKCHLPW